MNIWVCISYSINSNAHTTPVRIYGEPYAHKFWAVDIFLEYRQSSSNITPCQVPSRVRAWFHDSAGDIDFYQMSFSQSESTILHESIILPIITQYFSFVCHIVIMFAQQGQQCDFLWHWFISEHSYLSSSERLAGHVLGDREENVILYIRGLHPAAIRSG